MDFNEVQRFKVWWAWLSVIALAILFIYAIVQQIIIGIPFGPKPAPGYVLIIAELTCLLFLFFLRSIKLETKITDAGIYYQLYPFQLKETVIEWRDVRDAYMRQYNSFYEYGGWGLRVGTERTGRAVNTSASSSIGLQLEFYNEKPLLIGTRKPEEIELIIHRMISLGKINRSYAADQ